jgi:hypothetical protein
MENPLANLFPDQSDNPSDYVLVQLETNHYWILYKPRGVFNIYLDETNPDPLASVVDFLLRHNVEILHSKEEAQAKYGKTWDSFF